jgi:hypothetical protein
MTDRIFDEQVLPLTQMLLIDTAKLINGFRDPAFTKNREVPLHRWVPWVAGFSADFVQDCLNKYGARSRNSNVWVLDPFAGVGTTLLEAYIRGFNVLGFEINPYAALAARLKLEALQISPKLLASEIGAFERFMNRRCGNGVNGRFHPRARPPAGFSGRNQLFSPKVERKILFALNFVSSIEEERLKDLFRLALGSVMVGMSNYSYEPSLTRRSAVGKPDIKDASVSSVVSAKLQLMLADIKWLRDALAAFSNPPKARVFHASVFDAGEYLKRSQFVRLAVTSPPYLNNYHYPRNTRPQLHWLNFASGTGYEGARESDSFGKFWQTVRTSPPMRLSFSFPELEERIETIGNLNTDNGPYGGPGWANYVATYFNDTHRFCQVLARLLQPGGIAVVVLGNSIIQGVEVKTDYFFGSIAELCGLRFRDTLLLRNKRTGSSIIRSSVRTDKAATKTVLYESAIILEK